MAKPWFHEQPGPDGSWGDGRTDSDISFWRQFKACGNRLYITPRVCIGHGEYVITWPSQELGKPVFQYCNEWQETRKPPASAWKVD
jgi:hypothetical protein